MKKDIFDFIKDDIKLSLEEKNSMRSFVESSIQSNAVRKVTQARPSMYNDMQLSFSLLIKQKYMPIIIALMLLLGGGTTSVIAQNALPGDMLYPIKINVNENVESLLAISARGDALVDVKHADNRLKEAEKLALLGKLDDKKNEEIKASFTKELSSLNNHIFQFENNGATSTAIELRGQWKDDINNHYKAFLVISGMSTSTIATSTTASTSPTTLMLQFIKKEKDKNENYKGEKGDEKKTENRNIRAEQNKNEREDDEDGDDNDNNRKINIPIIATTTPVVLKTFTLIEVATHNTDKDCYTTVSGGVYDLTSWISQHPGGKNAIIGMCGIDATIAFRAQHAGQSRPERELASFKIGILVK